MLIVRLYCVWTGPLTIATCLILLSAFPEIVVHTRACPGEGWMISGLFFGLAFDMGGMGAAVLGRLADAMSIMAAFLPDLERERWERRGD